MKKQNKYLTLFMSVLILGLLAGCSSYDSTSGTGEVADVKTTPKPSSMPYGSADYENGTWTLDELVAHLEELGFDNISVMTEESRFTSKESLDVKVEDTESDSWFTEYTDFKRGEKLRTWRKVQITVNKPIPVLTEDNTPGLATFLAMKHGTDGDVAVWKSFMKEHNGEFIEFDGIICDWYDEMWYASGISFLVTFGEHEDITFGWSGLLTKEFGFDNDYSAGSVKEGIGAHIVVEIVCEGDSYYYALDSVELQR